MAWTILPGWLGAASIAYQTKREMEAQQAAPLVRGGKKNRSNKNKKNKRRNATRRVNH